MPIVIEGLDELLERMAQYPAYVKKSLRNRMEEVLIAVWEVIPPYPAPPANSTYERTGQLGRSLGSSEGGGKGGGEPGIYDIRENGDFMEADFGTNLEYAPAVIGENQDAHMSHWWTLPYTVANRALPKITAIFQEYADQIAAWLAGKGM